MKLLLVFYLFGGGGEGGGFEVFCFFFKKYKNKVLKFDMICIPLTLK